MLTVDPKKQAQKASGTAKPAHKAYVRQTGDGIRVSPSALNKKKHPKSQWGSRAFFMMRGIFVLYGG